MSAAPRSRSAKRLSPSPLRPDIVTLMPVLSSPNLPIFANEKEGVTVTSPGSKDCGAYFVTTMPPPLVMNVGLPTSVALWPRIVTERVICVRSNAASMAVAPSTLMSRFGAIEITLFAAKEALA